MVTGITPVAKKALEALAGSEVLHKVKGPADNIATGTMVDIWQLFLVPGVGPSPEKEIPSLLHVHSTLCLQRQRFPATALGRWDFSCIGSGCLRHDSDDYQALSELLTEWSPTSYRRGATYRIWRLLTALDLPVQPLLSGFFDEGFQDRCSAMLTTAGARLLYFGKKDEPYLKRYSCVVSIAASRLYLMKLYCCLESRQSSDISTIRLPLNYCWIHYGNHCFFKTVVNLLTSSSTTAMTGRHRRRLRVLSILVQLD